MLASTLNNIIKQGYYVPNLIQGDDDIDIVMIRVRQAAKIKQFQISSFIDNNNRTKLVEWFSKRGYKVDIVEVPVFMDYRGITILYRVKVLITLNWSQHASHSYATLN